MSNCASKQNTVAVIGELNVDLIASGLRSAPLLGGEIIAEDFAITLGSASAIFACGVAKLGHAVTFISKVGADEFGEFCLGELRASGVDVDSVIREAALKTGVTIALSTPRDRALVTYLGAIAALAYEELDFSLLRDHRHLHLTSYFLQTNLRPHFPEIMRRARALNLTTSFDPNSDPKQEWGADIWDALAETDVLFLNEKEALALTERRTVQQAAAVLGRTVPRVVIKRGAQGALACAEGRVVAAPGYRVDAVDTTGAGDSFAAGFVSGLLRKLSIEECLSIANACGALSTLRTGGTPGQPDSAALMKFLRAHEKTVN